jgi:hypothetical protein
LGVPWFSVPAGACLVMVSMGDFETFGFFRHASFF